MTARRLILALAVALVPATPAAAKPPCTDLLAGKVFRCRVTSSFGRTFQDCWRFTAPGTRSAALDLVADRVAEPFGCACRPGGRPAKPKFGGTQTVTCTGGGTTGLFTLALEGKVAGRRGKVKLRSGVGTNDAGDRFVFECALDPQCQVPPGG